MTHDPSEGSFRLQPQHDSTYFFRFQNLVFPPLPNDGTCLCILVQALVTSWVSNTATLSSPMSSFIDYTTTSVLGSTHCNFPRIKSQRSHHVYTATATLAWYHFQNLPPHVSWGGRFHSDSSPPYMASMVTPCSISCWDMQWVKHAKEQ